MNMVTPHPSPPPSLIKMEQATAVDLTVHCIDKRAIVSCYPFSLIISFGTLRTLPGQAGESQGRRYRRSEGRQQLCTWLVEVFHSYIQNLRQHSTWGAGKYELFIGTRG